MAPSNKSKKFHDIGDIGTPKRYVGRALAMSIDASGWTQQKRESSLLSYEWTPLN